MSTTKRTDFLVTVRCRTCGHAAEVSLPKVGRKLRCCGCGEVQLYGVRPGFERQHDATLKRQ